MKKDYILDIEGFVVLYRLMYLFGGIMPIGILIYIVFNGEFHQGILLFLVFGGYMLFRAYNFFNAIHRVEIINCEKIVFYSVLNDAIEMELKEFKGLRLDCTKNLMNFRSRSEFLIKGEVLKSYCWFDDVDGFKKFLRENQIDAFVTFKSA